MGKVIDAEFSVIEGPLRVGDEHPMRRGWYLTDKFDRRGNPLWYKTPHPVWRWLRPALLAVWVLLILAGMLFGMLYG